MIGIIGAMDIEVNALIEHLEFDTVECVSGTEYHSGLLCAKPVVIARCGIGKVNSALCAQTLILRYKPKLLINVGVAGSLSPLFGIGDIAIARDLVQHDVDTSALGDPLGMVSTVNRVHFDCAPWAVELVEDIVRSDPSLHGGTCRIATGDRFVAETGDKEWIHSTFSADACDMEGGSTAQVCYVNGVDCLVIRAISDSCSGEHAMEYSQFCRMAADQSASVLMAFMNKMK